MFVQSSFRTVRRRIQGRFEGRARKFGRHFVAAVPRHLCGDQKNGGDHPQILRESDGKRHKSRLFRRFQAQRGHHSDGRAQDERIRPPSRAEIPRFFRIFGFGHQKGRGGARRNARTSARSEKGGRRRLGRHGSSVRLPRVPQRPQRRGSCGRTGNFYRGRQVGGGCFRRQFRHHQSRPWRNRVCLLHRIFYHQPQKIHDPCGHR